jgi:tRNA-specific 2-thiouridylase
VPDGDYAGFIEAYTGKASPPGDFIDGQGSAIGRHEGIIRYTIGQRKGFRTAFHKRLYVRDKDASANTVTLADDGELYSTVLLAGKANWLITPPKHGETVRLRAKTRYNQRTAAWASVTAEVPTGGQGGNRGNDGKNNAMLRVVFDEPQRAIAKGQHVVLYDGEYVAGGGEIV